MRGTCIGLWVYCLMTQSTQMPFFYPLHLQPLLKKYALDKQADLPVTERLAKQGIYLPSYIGITNDDIEYVVEQLHASINEMA